MAIYQPMFKIGQKILLKYDPWWAHERGLAAKIGKIDKIDSYREDPFTWTLYYKIPSALEGIILDLAEDEMIVFFKEKDISALFNRFDFSPFDIPIVPFNDIWNRLND